MPRKALIIGVDYYDHFSSLSSCAHDANELESVLARHEDNHERNFHVEKHIASNKKNKIKRGFLKEKVKDLFNQPRDISLFYFSGHGFVDNVGGYLNTSENEDGDEGLSMDELLKIVNASPASEKIVILDCCHAGKFGSTSNESKSYLNEGVTILAASAENQYSRATPGQGSIFTEILIDALQGSASNILGEITPGSLYAHIDKSLGEHAQRPIFKTNVRRFTVLRRVKSQLSRKELLKIIDLFEDKNKSFSLNPSFEPEVENEPEVQGWKPIPKNVKKFKLLQKYNRVNLLVPIGAPHMYHAAIRSKSCRLTSQGKFYWSLIKNDRG